MDTVYPFSLFQVYYSSMEYSFGLQEEKGFFLVPDGWPLEKETLWNPRSFFKKEAPIDIELCSGHGHWIVERAEKNPERHFIAIEKKYGRAKKILVKRDRKKLQNLLVIIGEAARIIHYLFPRDLCENIYINFPDPWPKRRQEKHRLTKPSFLQEIARILKKSGALFLVTDHEEFSRFTCISCEHIPQLKLLFKGPLAIDYGYSLFYQLWTEQKKTILYHHFIRI